MIRGFVSQVVAFAAIVSIASAQNSTHNLPIVDLGYQFQRASGFNDSFKYYNFSNIRYAAPPVDDLRFRAPHPPATNRSQPDDGLTRRICPQGLPLWNLESTNFTEAYLAGRPYTRADNATLDDLPEISPVENEDCLFLDVFVPEEVFDNAGKGYGVPVLVWIYGGGYTLGSKSGSGSPAGLLNRSLEAPTTAGVIYVAMNYRLGALGWSAGPTLQSDGDANAGLLDQRFALEWVQEHIGKFGGDKDRVTIFGESAGGGSVMHQITAYGGRSSPSPFSGAIPQSPGFLPLTSPSTQESYLRAFLHYANVSSLAAARSLPSSTIIAANRLQIALDSPWGSYVYGPAVDGTFVPALPGQSLLYGNFDKSVRVLTGHNLNEGLLFTPPNSTTDAELSGYLRATFPAARDSVIAYIMSLYPAVYDGTYPWTDPIGRAATLVSEFVFTCNTNYLARAYGNDTYNYYFTIPPALHGQDIAYTYYTGDLSGPLSEGNNASVSAGVRNATVAVTLQEWITSFAGVGRPVGLSGMGEFREYGEGARVLEINGMGIAERRDPVDNERCRWWQKGLYS